ncbi:MAG TPA: hypothetical protein VN276_04925 [Bacteroidales bacterium]|nr:hypothetical protein [Bacteroidales bacterium]
MNRCTDNSLSPGSLIFICLLLAGSELHVKAQEVTAPDTLSRAFYDTIRVRSEKRKLTGLLYDMLFVAPPASGNKREKLKSTSRYDEFEGKVIRTRKVIRLNAFGTDIDNPIDTDQSKADRLLNSTYVKTHTFVLNQYLVFHEGDTVSALVMADNERLLRDLPFVEDARIIIVPADSNFVDVAVVVRENYPYGFAFQFDGIPKGTVKLFDKNFAGLGHELALTVPYDFDEYAYPGFGIKYAIRNIARTFSDLELDFSDGLGSTKMGGIYKRGFTTSETKYSWSASIRLNYTTEDLDTMATPEPLRYIYHDYWGARSFMLDRESVTRLIFSARYNGNNVIKRPEIDDNSYYRLQSYQLITGSIAISSQRFINTSLIYSYGRTEDIPYGYMLELMGGREFNEFKYRNYAGLKASFGNIFTRFGYIYGGVSFSTFYNEGNTEQGLFETRLKYFTPLIKAGASNIRTFVNIYYIRGFNRYSDEYLYLRNNDFIRGFRNDSINGDNRIIATFEPVLFTARPRLGFRFAFFAFADAGVLIRGALNSGDFDHISVFGAGVRIRNDRLVLNTIQIRLAWYPNLPAYSQSSWITVDGIVRLKPPGFEPDPPGVITYQ